MSKSLRRLVLALYCIALWVTFDLLYSYFIYTDAPNLRRWDAQYDHGLRPKVEGPAVWGPLHYTIHTDSLGFRNDSIRDVPLKSSGYRILLIGDSFTEGLGVEFEDTFAGLLAKAGAQRPVPIEFLNAGASSYSPVLYYRKIKALIESGLVFDEVVVLPDVSDVHDEATNYFCSDEDSRYRAKCPFAGTITPEMVTDAEKQERRQRWSLQRWFAGTNAIRSMIEQSLRRKSGLTRNHHLYGQPISAWTIAGYDGGSEYAPLGVEGGIARALQNMQSLADFLAARKIPLTLAVYPWPMQIAQGNPDDNHQVTIWRDFCAHNCKAFINLFPAFAAEAKRDAGWYERLFIVGDVHYSLEGNRLMFRELAKHLLGDPSNHAKALNRCAIVR